MKTLISIGLLLVASTSFAGDFQTPQGRTFKLPDKVFFNEPLYLPDRVVTNKGEIVSIIGTELDNRINECKAVHADLPQTTLDKAEWIIYRIKNSWTFPCEESPSAYCAGLTDASRNIWASLYKRNQGFSIPPGTNHAPYAYLANYELYLLTGISGWYTNTVNWATGDYLLPVICHELEHVWGAGSMSMEEGIPFEENL